MPQQTNVGDFSTEGVMDALTAMLAGDPYSGAKLHLYKGSFSPTPASQAADFASAEADYTGYAAAALTYSAVGLDASGNPTALTVRSFFQATDAVVPNTIGGCWVQKDVTGPPAVHTVVEYFPFSTPVSLTTALAFLGVVLGIQAPGQPGYATVDY